MRSSITLALVAAASLGSAQSVKLGLRFPPGKVDRVTTNTTMTMNMAMPGTTHKMAYTTAQSLVMLMRVADPKPSAPVLRMTYESLSSKMIVDGRPMNTQGPDIGKLVKGKTITLHFANGQLARVDGLKEVMAATMGQMNPEMQQALKGLLNERSVREMWAMNFGMFPARAIRIGETWSSNLEMGQPPIKMGLHLNMKLQGLENRHGRRMAKIGISGTGTMDLTGIANGAVKEKTNRFVVSGTSYFDLDRGWVTDQSMRMQVEGTMTATNAKTPQTSRFSMDVSVTSRVASVK